jgi:hypothetical protein
MAATKSEKKPRVYVQQPNVVFRDKEGVVMDYIKMMLGTGTNGRITDTTGSNGKITKMMGKSIGVRRLIYLALYSLETQIDSGEMSRDDIIDILAKSKVSIF